MLEWLETLWRLLTGAEGDGSATEPDPSTNLGGEIIEGG